MKVRFGDFCYLRQKQLLYKKDELIPLKRNQGALLELFVSDPHDIHSKNDILDAIWVNQDVSQQVVFQTISELRSILGRSAIKTFSGKGYKWNVPIQIEQPSSPPASKQHRPPETPDTAADHIHGIHNERKKPMVKSRFVAMCFVALSMVGLTWHYWYTSSLRLNLLVGQHTETGVNADIVKRAVEQVDNVSLSSVHSPLRPSEAFASPEHALNHANLDAGEWIVWGQLLAANKGAILRYGLSRHGIDWQGYVYAESQDGLTLALANRLTELKALGLFSASLVELDIHVLDAMFADAPDDPDLILLLAEHYENVAQLDVSLSFLQKMSKSQSHAYHLAYLAKAHLKTASIYKQRGQFLQAKNSLTAMRETLSQSFVWPLYFQYVEASAWLAYDETHYQEMNQVLTDASDALHLARQNGEYEKIEPLSVFKFHILRSILAKKTEDDEGKYHHLNEAQAILIEHKLDSSNLAVVLYHFALFAQQEEENHAALVYLQRIQELPRTSDNHWVHDAAFYMLVNHYMAADKMELAEALFPDADLSATQLLLKAELMIAKGKRQDAIPLFQSAFDKARLSHDIRSGVDAALRLYQHSSDDPKSQSEHRAYLETHTSQEWLTRKLSSSTSR